MEGECPHEPVWRQGVLEGECPHEPVRTSSCSGLREQRMSRPKSEGKTTLPDVIHTFICMNAARQSLALQNKVSRLMGAPA